MSLANLDTYAHFECEQDTPTGAQLMQLVAPDVGPHRLTNAGSCNACKVPVLVNGVVQPAWFACAIRRAIEDHKLRSITSRNELQTHVRHMVDDYQHNRLPDIANAGAEFYAQHKIYANLHYALSMIKSQLATVRQETDLVKKQEAMLVLEDIISKSKCSIEASHHI